jgi:hypothetical protein
MQTLKALLIFFSFFQFRAQFPHESQLTIILNNSSMLGSSEIGRTEVDLENRFYSKCYAACGIPKKYDRTGYNFWRDYNKPSQILSRLCKRFGFYPPEYTDKGLMILKRYGEENKHVYPKSQDGLNKKHDSLAVVVDQKNDEKNKKLRDSEIREKNSLEALNDWKNITGVSDMLDS